MNDDARHDRPMSRRALLGTIAASGTALVALTAGQSFSWLAPLNLFAPRVQGLGPQGLPINRTAQAAHVVSCALNPDWQLRVTGTRGTVLLSRARLAALPQSRSRLPIACVEGWSTSADWQGVRMRDLVALAGWRDGARIRVTSLEPRGTYRMTTMGAEFVQDAATLVALRVNGQDLDLQHGFPARVIAPGRPGVLQTKWLQSIEVLT